MATIFSLETLTGNRGAWKATRADGRIETTVEKKGQENSIPGYVDRRVMRSSLSARKRFGRFLPCCPLGRSWSRGGGGRGNLLTIRDSAPMGVTEAAIPEEEKGRGPHFLKSSTALYWQGGKVVRATGGWGAGRVSRREQRGVIITNIRRLWLSYRSWPPLSWLIMPLCPSESEANRIIYRPAFTLEVRGHRSAAKTATSRGDLWTHAVARECALKIKFDRSNLLNSRVTNVQTPEAVCSGYNWFGTFSGAVAIFYTLRHDFAVCWRARTLEWRFIETVASKWKCRDGRVEMQMFVLLLVAGKDWWRECSSENHDLYYYERNYGRLGDNFPLQ